MATQTPNLGLTLPVGGENVSRQIINQNMTLIDQYCGAINQSTYRLVPFTLAVNDWVSSGGQWVVNFLTAYVTASSDEIITFGSSLTNAQAHIIAEKKSGGGGVVFTTSTKPTGAIQGMIRIFDNDDHKIPILVEGTVTPIANGGTGQSTLSGAQQALGITALSNQVANLEKNSIGEGISLTANTEYTTTENGYIRVIGGSNATAVTVDGKYLIQLNAGNTNTISMYIKKGMKLKWVNGNGSATFFPCE